MKTRIISGTFYFLILVAFFLLKFFIPDCGSLLFDLLIYAFSLIGTFEMVRAMQHSLARTEKSIVYLFAVISVPACALAEYFFGYGVHVTAVCFFMLALALLSLLVFKNEETTPENIGAAFVSAVYPALILCLMVLANHIGEQPVFRDKWVSSSADLTLMSFNSDLAMVFIFSISPVSDVLALFTGLALKKKFPKKLAPILSPNKTVVGFIGGLVGGMLCAVIIYFVYNAILGAFPHMYIWLPLYIVIGLLAAAANAFGDLIESAIKRKKGLKDMGDIMPGHGGVLDRIDGTLFATVIVYAAFALIQLLAI